MKGPPYMGFFSCVQGSRRETNYSGNSQHSCGCVVRTNKQTNKTEHKPTWSRRIFARILPEFCPNYSRICPNYTQIQPNFCPNYYIANGRFSEPPPPPVSYAYGSPHDYWNGLILQVWVFSYDDRTRFIQLSWEHRMIWLRQRWPAKFPTTVQHIDMIFFPRWNRYYATFE